MTLKIILIKPRFKYFISQIPGTANLVESLTKSATDCFLTKKSFNDFSCQDLFFPALSTLAKTSHFRESNVFKNRPIRIDCVMRDSDEDLKTGCYARLLQTASDSRYHWRDK